MVLVEREARAVRALRQMAIALGAQNLEIMHTEAKSFLSRAQATFDVIFLDPPFARVFPVELLPQLAPRLKPHGLLYVESAVALQPPPGWQLQRHCKSGAVYFHLVERDYDA